MKETFLAVWIYFKEVIWIKLLVPGLKFVFVVVVAVYFILNQLEAGK